MSPSEPENGENRRIRNRSEISNVVEIVGLEDAEDDRFEIVGLMVDLTPYGIGMVVPQDIPVGTPLRMTFTIEDRQITATGGVVHSDPQPDMGARLRVTFHKIEPKSMGMIRDYLNWVD